jgi:tRNA 2-selenouridine synthase
VTEISSGQFLQGPCPSLTLSELLFLSPPPLFDVRTAEEYAQGHIPRALNQPLFDRFERSTIGTLYKQVSPESAMEAGLRCVEPRVQQMVESFQSWRQQPLVFYCARGGMRSASVVRLLNSEGFTAHQLRGGYKHYRQHVLQALEQWSPPLIVLHGPTGVGKTLLLKQLPDHVDLEGLAQHRSSLFGGIHRQPRTQRQFEGLLHQAKLALPANRSLFIEGESRKVGPVFIPMSLAKAMQKGQKILLHASLETRIDRTLADYRVEDEATVAEVDQILQSPRMALSRHLVDHLRDCLRQNRLRELVAILLNDYYDPRYHNSMKNYHYAAEFSAEDLDQTGDNLRKFRDEVAAASG